MITTRKVLLAIPILGLSGYCLSMALASLVAHQAGWPSILVDILIPGIAAAILVTLGCFGNQAAKTRLLAFSCSLLICLMLAEVVLQFRSGTPRLRNPPEVPPQAMADVLDQLRRKGVEAYPRYSPVMFSEMTGRAKAKLPQPDFIPLAGLSKVTIVHDDESGQWNNFLSDDFGFNNPVGSHREAPDLAVLLGDSFTAGSGVGREANIAGVLARLSRNVLNLGVIGNGPLAELACLREYALPLKPRDVVWIYYEGNDLDGLEEELRGPLAAYLDNAHSQDLRGRQSEVDSFLAPLLKLYSKQKRERHWIVQAAKLSSLRHHFRVLIGGESTMVGSKNLRMLCRVLDRAVQATKAAGARFTFVYLPTSARFHPSKSVQKLCDTENDPPKRILLEHLRQQGVNTLDLVEEMRRVPDPDAFYPFFPPSGHFNVAGYEFVGRRIHELLTKGS